MENDNINPYLLMKYDQFKKLFGNSDSDFSFEGFEWFFLVELSGG